MVTRRAPALESDLKRRQILRPFYALIGIVAISVTLVGISTSITRTGARTLREELVEFHARGAMLTSEASNHLSELETKVGHPIRPVSGSPGPIQQLEAQRAIDYALFSLGQTLDSIIELHRQWPQPAGRFSGTIERAARQYRELGDVGRGPQPATEFTALSSSLEFTLFQLDRLHSIGTNDLMARIDGADRRSTRRTATAIGLVPLVAGVLALRILLLVGSRLREHDQIERALRERERQIQQSSKLEALGGLVGGVAHDFNNLLTAILGNVEILEMGLEPADARKSPLQEIRGAGERAAGLTRQLLAFSRQQAVELKVVDLNLLIRDLEPLLRRLIREDITLVMQLDAANSAVELDPLQIEQVLMNLAINSRDAMPNGGLLSITTSQMQMDDGQPGPALLDPGNYIRLVVEDSGCGMTPEVIARAFDPFFTTKALREGTGLGLSTVHGIVTEIGGQISVHSEPGDGARFELLLPRSDKPLIDRQIGAEPEPASRGCETVLVAEDEPQVRGLLVGGLRSAGYDVLEASDGAEALQLCQDHPGSIDLILSDVVMPGMRGPEMVERALESQPAARVIYVSGYTGDELITERSASQAPLLPKPFRLQELLKLVRRELGPVEIPVSEPVNSAGEDPRVRSPW